MRIWKFLIPRAKQAVVIAEDENQAYAELDAYAKIHGLNSGWLREATIIRIELDAAPCVVGWSEV